MRSKDIRSMFNVYKYLSLNNRKVYTYGFCSCTKCIESEYFYTSFSEAVSEASVEALEESEIYKTPIFVLIYELSSADDDLHPLKRFEVCFIADEE